MRCARVLQAARLSSPPNKDAGSEPVVQILTDLPAGGPNAFYMAPVDPLPQLDDSISFDIAAGFLDTHHEVEWAGRRIRQRGYSFDWMAQS